MVVAEGLVHGGQDNLGDLLGAVKVVLTCGKNIILEISSINYGCNTITTDGMDTLFVRTVFLMMMVMSPHKVLYRFMEHSQL